MDHRYPDEIAEFSHFIAAMVALCEAGARWAASVRGLNECSGSREHGDSQVAALTFAALGDYVLEYVDDDDIEAAVRDRTYASAGFVEKMIHEAHEHALSAVTDPPLRAWLRFQAAGLDDFLRSLRPDDPE